MDAIALSPVRWSPAAVSVDASTPRGDMEIVFSVEGADLSGDPSFLVPTLLTPAMRSGNPLAIDAPVSPRMLAGARHVAEIFSLWREDLKLVDVVAPTRSQHPPEGAAKAAFFSAGVDSFHTVLKHRDELTHLIFIHGVFDQKVDGETVGVARDAARALGLPLVEVTTTARKFADACDVALSFSHGNILAAVAVLFESTFGTVWIPSSYSYDHMPHWGSHPLTDPLWSTESLQILHDGAEATRAMKIDAIASDDVAMRHLRVCHVGSRYLDRTLEETGHLNCGLCEKCLRTMVGLRAVDALDRCLTFQNELDLELVRALVVDGENALANVAENLHMVEARGSDQELAKALRDCLANNDVDPDHPMSARDLAFRIRAHEAQAAKLERRLARSEQQAAHRAARLDEMQRSLSWRLTAPLRAPGRRRR